MSIERTCPAQVKILEALGDDELTLRQVADRIPGDPAPRVSFSQTVQRMEKKGLLTSRRETMDTVPGIKGIRTVKYIRKPR